MSTILSKSPWTQNLELLHGPMVLIWLQNSSTKRSRFTVKARGCAKQDPPNCPHKLTKTAEPWLGGGAAFGRLRTARGRHVGCSSLLLLHVSGGSRRAARGGRHGGRFLQLRVTTLGRSRDLLEVATDQSRPSKTSQIQYCSSSQCHAFRRAEGSKAAAKRHLRRHEQLGQSIPGP